MINVSCRKDNTPKPITQTYLHISHTRTNQDPEVHSALSTLVLDDVDMTWLGGDIGANTSFTSQYMDFYNSIFDFGSENTLWSLGNHDYANTVLVEQYTQRPTYYSYHKNGITYLVLDTQIDNCSVSGNQLELFQAVTDTIQESSHLVILHHKLIWLYDHPTLHDEIDNISNGMFGTCGYCLHPNNFYSELYPTLVDVKQRGVSVLCIGGDIGAKTKQFSHQTQDGIHFLASGLDFSTEDNYILVFNHSIKTRDLVWTFLRID